MINSVVVSKAIFTKREFLIYIIQKNFRALAIEDATSQRKIFFDIKDLRKSLKHCLLFKVLLMRLPFLLLSHKKSIYFACLRIRPKFNSLKRVNLVNNWKQKKQLQPFKSDDSILLKRSKVKQSNPKKQKFEFFLTTVLSFCKLGKNKYVLFIFF